MEQRETRIVNLTMNIGVIMFSLFEGVFTEMMSGFVKSMVKSMAPVGGKTEDIEGKTEEVAEEIKTKIPANMKAMIKDMKGEIMQQAKTKESEIKEKLKDPMFDEGLRIVDSYDFNLPKLTEDLSESDIATYIFLMQSKDEKFLKMWSELMGWMKKSNKGS